MVLLREVMTAIKFIFLSICALRRTNRANVSSISSPMSVINITGTGEESRLQFVIFLDVSATDHEHGEVDWSGQQCDLKSDGFAHV